MRWLFTLLFHRHTPQCCPDCKGTRQLGGEVCDTCDTLASQ